MRKLVEMMKNCGLGLARHCEAAQITHALTRHCEALKTPKQSITHAVRFWREFTLKNTNSYPKNATLSRSGLLRILRMLAMTNFGAWLCKFKAMSFNFRRFSTNTHPQTPSAREGAFCRVFASLVAVAFVAFLAAPQNLKAEQSGWFMGVQAGYGVGERQRQLEAVTKRTTNIQNSRYVFADEFGNINTIQKEERLPEITGSWFAGAKAPWNGAGDQKVNGYSDGTQYINTYKIVGTYTFDPTDPSTYKFTSASAQSVKDAIASYVPGGATYESSTWTSGTLQQAYNTRGMVELNESLKGVNAGLLAGYKHFFSTKFGLRVYGLLDYSYYKGSDSALLKKMQSYNANLNLDVLYNLIDKNDKIMGVFAGLSVGGAQYISSKTRLASDIDIGLNFGLRFGAGKHSIELFSRIGGLFVGAEHYSTSDTDYISENMRLDSSTTNWLKFDTDAPTTVGYIRVCPASVAECGAGGTGAGFNGFEQGTGTGANAVRAQYRYRVFRYHFQDTYVRETTEAAAGSRMVDSYKQPYKIGIRYIYSF